ncbi:hypothetical protein [Achromobacter ruhlandii]|uniref:hypothetical protein n=1 Tax=Achromobacter ruhlandii TaxID=72557 RepID=UPI003BA3AA6A
MHVDGIAESVVFTQVGRALFQRQAQRRPEIRMLGDARGFERQELAAVHALAHGLHVIGQRIGEAGRMQPHPHPGVAFLHQDHGTQPGLLQAGREQHGQIQAGGHAGLQDAVGRADLLAVDAERRGRLGVMQRFGRQRAVDRRHLFPDHVAALGLVAVHGQVVVLLAQQPGGLADQAIHGRVVGHGKRGQQFRQGARAGPLVVGQHGHGLRGPAHFAPAGQRRHLDGGALGLLLLGQVGMVGRQVQRRDAADFARHQRVEAQPHGLCEGRIATDVDLDVLERLLRAVAQPQRAQDRHRVLDRRVAQRRIGLDLDRDRVRRARDRAGRPGGMRRTLLNRRGFQL